MNSDRSGEWVQDGGWESLMTALEKIDICSNPDVAYTMPASCYTDAQVFRMETERIFARCWIAVLASSDV
jgi:hypothetical protein